MYEIVDVSGARYMAERLTGALTRATPIVAGGLANWPTGYAAADQAAEDVLLRDRSNVRAHANWIARKRGEMVEESLLAQGLRLGRFVSPAREFRGFGGGIDLATARLINITDETAAAVTAFQNATETPWTKVVVASGLTMILTRSITVAEGVIIESPKGGLGAWIDGRNITSDRMLAFRNGNCLFRNFFVVPSVGNPTDPSGNNPAGGVTIQGGAAHNIVFAYITFEAARAASGDASETLDIWAYPDAAAAPGDITLYRVHFRPNGTKAGGRHKAALIGGRPGVDSSRTRASIIETVLADSRRNPLIGGNVRGDFENVYLPATNRIEGLFARENALVHFRGGVVEKTTDTTPGRTDIGFGDAARVYAPTSGLDAVSVLGGAVVQSNSSVRLFEIPDPEPLIAMTGAEISAVAGAGKWM